VVLVSLRRVASYKARAIGVDVSEVDFAQSNLSTAIYFYTVCLGLSLICLFVGRVKRRTAHSERMLRWDSERLGEKTPLLGYDRNVEAGLAA